MANYSQAQKRNSVQFNSFNSFIYVLVNSQIWPITAKHKNLIQLIYLRAWQQPNMANYDDDYW
jgi:hypothetical protein